MRCLLVVSLFLVACGDDGGAGRLADAPPSNPVTLTITSNGAPVSGVHVYFLTAADTLVKTADTDATGTASAVMAAGGSVTAVNPFPDQLDGNAELRTFVGVEPGDHLVLTDRARDTVAITVLAPEDPAASGYDLLTTCGTSFLSPDGGGGGSGSAGPGGMATLTNCHGIADVAIVARDGETGLGIGGLFHAGVTVTNGGTVDLSGDTYQALDEVTFTYTNAPDAQISVLHSSVVAHGRLAPFSATASGGTGTSREPAVAATSHIVDSALFLSGEHHVVEWGPPTAAYTLDLANVLLPDLSGEPSFDFAARRLTWTEDAAGAPPDLTITGITVLRGEPTSRSWRWVVAAPYTPGALAFPRLPSDVADWTPATGDTVFYEQVMNAKLPGGYDAARAHIHDLREQVLDASGAQPDLSSFAAGASGRAVVVQSPNLRLGATR